ncbi:MAG: hypothetical protein J6T88_06880 [Bacteroidales bacterium]|nr:hypothetical protein [Bacteroidales bacterium]
MKSDKFIVFLFALLCVAFAGCNRDKDSEVFTAITQGFSGSKDYMGGNIVYWSDGDVLRINGGTYAVSVDGEHSNRATVNAEGVADFGGEYYAAYPASISSIAANGRVTFNIMEEESYSAAGGRQVVHSIMAAKANGSKLLFQNLCAMLHFKVKGSGSGIGAKLYAVEVESDKPLCGTMTADYNDATGNWEVTSFSADANTKRTLKFTSPLVLSDAEQDCYLVVPPVNDGTTLTLRFVVEDGNGTVKVFEKNKVTDVEFRTGDIYHFNDVNTYDGSKMMYGSNEVTARTMDGSENYPYQVYSGTSWSHLMTRSIMGNVNYIELNGDINVSSTYTDEQGFKAVLDGKGHTITLTTANISLISAVSGGKIRNVTIRADSPVTSPVLAVNGLTRYFGALACRAYSNAEFVNCVNKVDMTCDVDFVTAYVGGLLGNVNGCTMTDCRNEGIISSNAYCIGGVAGQGGIMTRCRNTGAITVTSSSDAVRTIYCGGVAGYANSTAVTDCYNTGAITIAKKSSNDSYYGGVCGLANVNVTGCYNTGTIACNVPTDTKKKYIGGVVGYNENGTDVAMLNCYNEGAIIMAVDGINNMYVGGLLAIDKKMSIRNCYAYCPLQGTYVCGITAYGVLQANVDIENCYYYGSITCESSNKFGIAGSSGNTNEYVIDSCYYPSDYTICHSSCTNKGTSATLSSAVALSDDADNSNSLRDALNRSGSLPSGWAQWTNCASPAHVVFGN